MLLTEESKEPTKEEPKKRTSDELKKSLATAMANENAAAIQVEVQQARSALGDNAGIPEVPDEYLQVPANAKILTPVEARQGMSPHFKRLEQIRSWKIGVDPTKLTGPKLTGPLREPAAVIACMSAVARAKLDGPPQC